MRVYSIFDQRADIKNRKEEKTLEAKKKKNSLAKNTILVEKCHPYVSLFVSYYSKSRLSPAVFSTSDLEVLGLGPTHSVMGTNHWLDSTDYFLVLALPHDTKAWQTYR